MSGRRLWLLVVVSTAAVTAASTARGLPWSIVLAAAGAAWLAGQGAAGRVAAASVVASACVTAIGPWTGAPRLGIGLLVIVIVTAALSVIGAGVPRTVSAVLVGVVLLSVVLSAGAPTHGRGPRTARLESVDAYLRREVERAQLPGVAVAVVRGDRVLFEHGYGSDGDGDMTSRSSSVIGSTSKSITATAVLQLVEDGRIDLDAPVRTYLPWFDTADRRGRRITVRQLLLDTSGIPTWAGWRALGGDGRAADDELRSLVDGLRLTSRPGERFQYSNANYIVLGEIVEAVSGETYASYVERAIFGPLHMRHSAGARRDGNATPYRSWFGIPIASRLPYLEVGLPAGAISSSAGDLARYLGAHLTNGSGILDASTVDLLHEPAVEAEGFGVAAGRRYAMGWYVGEVAGERAVFHSGDVFDSSSSLVMLPERDLGVVVVATSSSALTPVAKTLAEGVTAVLVDQPPPSLSGPMAVATLAAVTLLAMLLAFAVVRARRLLARPIAGGPAVARAALVDVVIPAGVLVGLPIAFSTYLDRAETVDPLSFWRIVTRGLPDVGWLLLLSLLLRLGVGATALARTAIAGARRPAASPAALVEPSPDV